MIITRKHNSILRPQIASIRKTFAVSRLPNAFIVCVCGCYEDWKTQTKSEADGGNEFERSARLSCDWMIILAVSPSWKWPPLTGSSRRDKVCVCACAACICSPFILVVSTSCICCWCGNEKEAHSKGNLICCNRKDHQTCRYTHQNFCLFDEICARRKIMRGNLKLKRMMMINSSLLFSLEYLWTAKKHWKCN